MSALPAPQRRTGGPDPGPDPPPGAAPLRPPPANERRALRRRPRPSQPHRIQTAERDGARAGGRARGGLRGGGANGNIRAPSDAPPPSLPPPNPTAAGAAPASRLPPFSPPLTPHPAGKRPQRERGFAGAGARPGAAPSPHDNSGVLSAGGAAAPSLLSSPPPPSGRFPRSDPPQPIVSRCALSSSPRRPWIEGTKGAPADPFHCGCGAAAEPPRRRPSRCQSPHSPPSAAPRCGTATPAGTAAPTPGPSLQTPSQRPKGGGGHRSPHPRPSPAPRTHLPAPPLRSHSAPARPAAHKSAKQRHVTRPAPPLLAEPSGTCRPAGRAKRGALRPLLRRPLHAGSRSPRRAGGGGAGRRPPRPGGGPAEDAGPRCAVPRLRGLSRGLRGPAPRSRRAPGGLRDSLCLPPRWRGGAGAPGGCGHPSLRGCVAAVTGRSPPGWPRASGLRAATPPSFIPH